MDKQNGLLIIGALIAAAVLVKRFKEGGILGDVNAQGSDLQSAGAGYWNRMYTAPSPPPQPPSGGGDKVLPGLE